MLSAQRIGSGASRVLIALSVFLISVFSNADTVDNGNITVFANGQAAQADEVNGNFDELIAQINDHASRLNNIEAVGSVLGDNFVAVDCGADGPDALHDAITNSPNAVGTLTVAATGACSEVAIFRRGVLIIGTDLSITADSANPRAEGAAMSILAADVRLIAGQGSTFFNILGNGEPNSLVLNQDAQVLLAGVNVEGATEVHTAVSGFSSLAYIGTNSVGTSNDNAIGIRALNSRILLLTAGGFTAATLNLNSTGTAIESVASTLLTLELVAGSTQLNAPNAVEMEFAKNSVATLGPFSIGGSGFKMRIADNSSVTVEGSALFNAAQAAALTGTLVVDRGGILRLDYEEAPTDATFTHTGDAEIGVNSAVDAFGSSNASAITFAGGTDATTLVAVNSSLILNSATFASDTLTVINASTVFAPGSQFDDGQPTIEVSYNGTIVDFDPDGSGILTSAVTSCTAGGEAYFDTGADACPAPP